MLYDKDIREPLFDFLDMVYGKNRIIEEKTMGKSRADIVMVTTDALYGIEIKSDADTYARLSGQVKDYDRYFDYNYVVIGTTHASHIKERVPDYWGIITVEQVDNQIDFYIYRKPQPNSKVNIKKQMTILWRPEIADIQLQNNMPKYKNLSKDYVIDKIIERTLLPEDNKNHIKPEILKCQISEALFERDYANVKSILGEYRKSELQKRIEAELDPQKKIDLMMELESKRNVASKNGFKKTRKKRYRRRTLI